MNAFAFDIDLLLIYPAFEAKRGIKRRGKCFQRSSTAEAKYEAVCIVPEENLPKVTVISADGLNVYDVLKHKNNTPMIKASRNRSLVVWRK